MPVDLELWTNADANEEVVIEGDDGEVATLDTSKGYRSDLKISRDDETYVFRFETDGVEPDGDLRAVAGEAGDYYFLYTAPKALMALIPARKYLTEIVAIDGSEKPIPLEVEVRKGASA